MFIIIYYYFAQSIYTSLIIVETLSFQNRNSSTFSNIRSIDIIIEINRN